MNKSVSRRDFLKGSLKAAGLTIAVSVSPSGYRLLSAHETEKETSGVFEPNVWLNISPDNMITVFVSRSEMGQGPSTSLPMILADELEADWKQVRFKQAPYDPKYDDPVWKMQITGGSVSVRHFFEPMRKAGAAAREMLTSAAAKKWNAPEKDCETSNGTVRLKKTGKSLTYGQLADQASKIPVPQNPSLKKKSQFRYIGESLPRLDIPDKVSGAAVFGSDVFVPGMLYASVARPPVYGAKLVSYNMESAGKVKGVRHVVKIDRGVAVCADTPDAAWNGVSALDIKWDKGEYSGLNNETIEKTYLEKLEKPGPVARKQGDVREALNKASKKLEATYLLPYFAHATMEPMNCTAHVGKDRCDVWIPTQYQTKVFQVAVKETGLKPEQIHVNTTYLGCGFGRRAEPDVPEEAIQISKAVGKPIKLVWTREEDFQNDFYRTGNSCKITAGLDDKGRIIAWSHRAVATHFVARHFPSMVKNGIEPAAVEGIMDTEYEFPNFLVEDIPSELPIPCGFWRSVGHTQNAFTMESFMDELADAAKKDPLEFRLNHLKNHPRSARVLKVAAEKAGWGKPPGKGQGRGIARHFCFGSHAAQVVEVFVDKKGRIKVQKVVCAFDCGPVVNPDNIRAQMESAVVMGLSTALGEQIDFENGGVKTQNFSDYGILSMSETPEIEVHIIKSDEKMGGAGEPGFPPVGPALANAIFNATGVRVRRLPILRHFKV